jgi:long-chain acyl-CoA synthetase
MNPEIPKTLPGLLKRNAALFGHGKVALREKEFGIWQSVSWAAYYDNVRYLALGLEALGYQKGGQAFGYRR